MTWHKNEYENIDSMWRGIIRDCLTDGVPLDSREGPTMEVIGWSGRLRVPSRNVLFSRTRRFSPIYAAAELLWYMSLSNRLQDIAPYAPQWKKYAESDDVYGAYGGRLRNLPGWVGESGADAFDPLCNWWSQLDAVIELLREKPNTRQAIVTLWDSGDLPHAVDGDKGSIPCTLTWQFIQRNGVLHMIVNMRSNDVWFGVPYDIFAFTSVQQLLALELGCGVGTYTHHVGSMHIYSQHVDACKAALEEKSYPTLALRHDHEPLSYARKTFSIACQEYAMNERSMGKMKHIVEFNDLARVASNLPRSLLRDCLYLCIDHRCPTFDSNAWLTSNRLRHSLELFREPRSK